MEKITFCGDVWLPAESFLEIPAPLSEALVLNLEAPLTNEGKAADGKICLRSDPDAFDKTFSVPPLAVCLANNHIMDYGEIGFTDTLSHLRRRGIAYFGAGTSGHRCNNPLVMDVGGIKIGLMGYVCPSTHPIFATEDTNGVAPIDLSEVAKDVKRAKAEGAQRLVVCLHWGEEEVWLPKPEDVEKALGVLNLGVDLVVGHHAHCCQPVMKGVLNKGVKYAFFGLGNAYFPDFEYRHHSGDVSWKRQRIWNRTAAWISYFPKTSLATWDTYREESGRFVPVKSISSKIEEWDIAGYRSVSDAYKRRFNRAKRSATFRNVISRFASKPRIPSVSSIQYVIKSILR